ncbi:MAG TPA: hypothetical protein VMU39_15040 [Solirubrobacteraceae bacterium]|nr:hypothetical protein [Solirubrobacteraceae bacterium]
MADVPTPDEQAHDILAAEAFAMPASDPELHHGPVVVPDDPAGITEPHDVLAAEEFPMPAMLPHASLDATGSAGRTPLRLGLAAAAGILALLVIRSLRRR